VALVLRRAVRRPDGTEACGRLFGRLLHASSRRGHAGLPGPAAVALGAAAVFVAGLIWSLMYVRYQSVWPGYLSHAIVDLCVFGLGAALLFGG